MDSMAAAVGTGPATSPLTVVRRSRRRTLEMLPTDRTLVMGILNVTPDSFSDGGEHFDTDTAIEHGLRMHYTGADLVDVGGESTRPGATPVQSQDEQQRILPVVEALLRAGAVVSVDTLHVETARAALQLATRPGEIVVNDVSGLTHEPGMPELIATTGAPYVITHNRGDARTMDSLAHYDDVVEEVVRELAEVKDRFLAAGVRPEQLILDPGLGFAKSGEQNWEVLRRLDRLQALGFPVLVAASRKRFLGAPVADGQDTAPPAQTRDAATTAITALAAAQGAWAVRVHDVGPSVDAVRTAAAWLGSDGAPTRRRHGV